MPKPVALTSGFLRSVRPPEQGQVEHADGGCPGLRLRVSAGGAATWILGCRDQAGKPRRFTIGAFPAVGLAAARDGARTLREEVRRGRDPVAEARLARQTVAVPANARPTLAMLLDGYARDVGARRRSWPEMRRRIENVFAAYVQADPIALVGPELQLTVDGHPSRSSAGAAVRYLRPVLKWGAKRGLVQRGVAELLDPPEGALAKRQRRLDRAETRAILQAVGVSSYHQALRWLFLTACRLNEACEARWQDVDLKAGIWTIPTTKQGGAHVVPLSRQAAGLLRARLPRDAAGDPCALPDGLIFANEAGGVLANWHEQTQAIQRRSGTAGWHRHDIRRTAASFMGDIGIAPHVVETALGHKLRTSSDGSTLGRVASVYNLSRYRAEQADALQQLADELDLIETSETNVVRLSA